MLQKHCHMDRRLARSYSFCCFWIIIIFFFLRDFIFKKTFFFFLRDFIFKKTSWIILFSFQYSAFTTFWKLQMKSQLMGSAHCSSDNVMYILYICVCIVKLTLFLYNRYLSRLPLN